MEFTVQQIADMLGGIVEGNPSRKISALAKIEEAGDNTLAFLSNQKYEPYLYTTHAAAVIVASNFELKQAVDASLIRVEDPYTSFSRLLEEYQKALIALKTGVEEPAYMAINASIGQNFYRGAFSYIGSSSQIGDNARIYPHVYIGENVKIGHNAIIFAGAKIYPDTVIGDNCTIHAGAVIGSDGFGFAPQKDGTYKAIPQIGNVIIGNNVSIGSNTTIDCATMSATLIGDGTKIDNLVQIAHNVEIGKHTVVAAQTGISGSSKIGDYCTIAGQVGIVGHITIANKTIIGAQSGVSKSVKEEGTIIQGSPAFDYKQNLRCITVFRKLPELQKEIEELKEKL